MRGRLCGILRKAKVPKDNLSKEQRNALKNLRKEKNIVILPADKGNSTVLMDTSDYDSKIRNMLESGTYRVIKKDPTKTQEDKICRILKSLEKNGEIGSGLCQKN